jgi:AcrR family transcriptional regulator
MAVGRPRAFDMEKTLDQALQVFLRKGYEGASLSELTEAMGINPPSLYAAFGNKEGLFRLALDRYVGSRAGFTEDAMAAPTARESAERLLRGTIEAQTKGVPGCLLVHGALACADTAEPIRRELATRRNLAEDMLYQRFERGVQEGDLQADTDTRQLARYVATMLQGTAVQAAGGATFQDLASIVDLTMRAFPPAALAKKKKG